jgi:hypothetical protein
MDKNIFYTHPRDYYLRPLPSMDDSYEYEVINKYPGKFCTMRDLYRDNPWRGASVYETPTYFRFLQNTSPWDEDIINPEQCPHQNP